MAEGRCSVIGEMMLKMAASALQCAGTHCASFSLLSIQSRT